MSIRIVLVVLFSTIASAASAATATATATFTAGTGPGCQFTTIQAAINAAAGTPGFNVVAVRDQTWTGQAITIGTQNVTIRGGFANCTDAAPTLSSSLVSGQGAPAAAVFSIFGSGVKRFERLIISRGDATGMGGGIRFNGTGELVLNSVVVQENTASDGGGIFFRSNGGIAEMTFEADVDITFNEADADGGGIRIEGDAASMFAIGPGISINNNIAGDEGGGIFVRNGPIVRLSSTGVGLRGTLSENGARRGGGIAVGDDDGSSKLFIYSTAADQPQRITGNVASERGGAVHVLADSNFPSGGGEPYVCIFDSYIAANRAEQGSAFFTDTSGGRARLVLGSPSRHCNLSGFGAVRCQRNRFGCNLLENNVNQLPGGQASVGATIQSTGGWANLRIENFVFGNNVGTRLIDASGLFGLDNQFFSPVALKTNLFARNTTSSDLIRWSFGSGAEIEVQNNTIAANTIGGSVFKFADGPEKIKFNNNLVFEPGNTAIDLPFPIANSANYSWDYNIAHPPLQLPVPFNNITGDPRFENEAVNDFRLRAGSQLVDIWAGAATTATEDLDERARPVTIPVRRQQSVDVGAYERQLADPFIVDGGFAASLAYWQPSANGEVAPGVVWDAGDANGAANSGSALVNVLVNPTPARLTVLRRCFNVPGYGRYVVRAKRFRGNQVTSDGAVLRWRVRYGSPGGTCNAGPIDVEGDAMFAAGSGWQELITPLEIDVPQANYGTLTTIELRLDATDAGIQVGTGLTGVRFDDVSIALVSADALFKDSFEQ